MKITQQKKQGIPVLSLNGRLDTLTADDLGRELSTLIEQQEYQLILDLAEVDFVSSSGFRVLLVSAKTLNQQKGKLVICCLQPKVDRLFDLAGFKMLLSVYASVEESLEKMEQ